jgi:hypothetical protein
MSMSGKARVVHARHLRGAKSGKALVCHVSPRWLNKTRAPAFCPGCPRIRNAMAELNWNVRDMQ